MKELKFEELTVEQKLGMVMHGYLLLDDTWEDFEDNLNYTIELIKKHALGAVWVSPTIKDTKRIIDAVKEAADYPILIFCDAESGIGDYQIGRHNAIGTAGSEELAYTFGKVTAVTARKMGYNVVCDPVIDMKKADACCGGNMRALGSDKVKVAKLGKAIARGMHDGGILTVAKHYPSALPSSYMDSHMAETYSLQTKEELLDYNLHPYLELMKENLMDGIMVAHINMPNIDPDYPSSLSEKVIGIIREQGFDGFAITDALPMMSIRSKFGIDNPPGLAIAAGNDIANTWRPTREAYESMLKCYENGLISDDRLDEAVKRVLAAQHKVLVQNKDAEITEKDIENFKRINTDSIYARTDDGITASIPTDEKHLFVLVVKSEQEINSEGKISVDTFTNDWYKPALITKKIEELFPNSEVRAIPQFPTNLQNKDIEVEALKYEDVIFINFTECPPYAGSDHITQRLAALINALIISKRVSTVVNFGNPYVLEDLMHVKRLILGGISTDSTMAGLEVLAGNLEAKGVLTYDVNFK